MAPLHDIRILDFTRGIAGPMACMLLADYGADVVRIEAPGGDPSAGTPGYVCWNRNKERVVLDLHTAAGLRNARELLARADAAVFDQLPGELERLGLDAITVRAANPRLLHAWLPPYAREGRWSQLPPDDALLSAVSCVSAFQLSYEDRPTWLVTPQASYGHAMIAACAIASGLWERRQSGEGQALEVSGLHGVSALQPHSYTFTAGSVRMSRNSRGGAPNYSLYRCADDRWLFLGSLVPLFFLKALDAMDLYDVLNLPGVEGEFGNLLLLPEQAQEAMRMLDARFAEKPRAEWLRILQEAGVPCAPAGDREEWFRGDTISANEMRLTVQDERLGEVELPGLNIKFGDTPGELRHLQQDTTPEAVLARWTLTPGPSPAHTGEGSPAADGGGVADSALSTQHSALPQGPLAGVRILDLGAFIAGTFAPTVLANYGADVIKIEPPEGDGFRLYGLMFIGNNEGKRSVVLDLKSPAGRETFYDMVRQADVVLDNYRMGVRERLGVDYTTLSAINPRIITCSVTGYGPKGRLSPNPGFDPLLQAESGMMLAQGGGGTNEPVFHQIAVNDTATAMMAALGMVLALHARERTGRGQEVWTCLANQTILCQSGELTTWPGAPRPPVGGRDFLGPGALRRFYATADGWIALSAREPLHFHQAAVALGHPEWAGRITAEAALHEAPDGWLAEAIAGALAALTAEEAVDRLLTAGVPAATALPLNSLQTDPWLAANGMWWDFEHPDFGPIRGCRSYGEFSRTPGGFPRRAPLLGEHTEEVLRELGIEKD